jgi:hypothetical protein
LEVALQRPHAIASSATERRRELLEQVVHDHDGLVNCGQPFGRDGEADGAGVEWVWDSLHKSGPLEGSGQLRDVDRIEPGVIGQLALARAASGTSSG